jgi:hypothetical protein
MPVPRRLGGCIMLRWVCVAAAALIVGCSSYETTYFVQNERGEIENRVVAGVPIVVTVPQKIGFVATESRYLVETRSEQDGKDVVARREVTETTVDRTPISLGASQLANLDVKRPFYGTAKTSMKLENQYPTELSSEVDDKTFGRILDTVDKLIEKQGEGTQGSSPGVTKTLLGQRTYLIVYDPQTQQISRRNM